MIIHSRGKKSMKPLNPVERKQVRRIVDSGLEPHYTLGAINSTADIAGTLAGFGQPSQGNAYNQRDGDRIQYVSLQGSVEFVTADTTNTCRFIIFQYMYSTGTAPTLATLLAYTNFPSLSSANPTYSNRYNILWDSGPLAVNTVSEVSVVRRFNIKRHKLRRTHFDAGATTGKGVLYVAYFSDSSAATHPTVRAEIKAVFKEI